MISLFILSQLVLVFGILYIYVILHVDFRQEQDRQLYNIFSSLSNFQITENNLIEKYDLIINSSFGIGNKNLKK